jgi:hypothetical protein
MNSARVPTRERILFNTRSHIRIFSIIIRSLTGGNLQHACAFDGVVL